MIREAQLLVADDLAVGSSSFWKRESSKIRFGHLEGPEFRFRDLLGGVLVADEFGIHMFEMQGVRCRVQGARSRVQG